MKTFIVWEHSSKPAFRGRYTILLEEGGHLLFKTAHWSPTSGLWFCDCKCVEPEAWATTIEHY